MSFTKWTDIENFHNVRKAINKYDHLNPGRPITYRGKIKLHGTNAGIVIKPNGDMFAQSRTSTIGTGNDNAGFAAWVESTVDHWRTVVWSLGQITIFGEWCGPGVQKGVAITQVDGKQFAIFSMQFGEYDEFGNASMIIEPTVIESIIGTCDQFPTVPDNVHVLPWYGDEITVDFADTESLEAAVDLMNKEVEAVEAVDPWVKKVFGVEGTGEGIVYYPVSFAVSDHEINRADLSAYMFKAKGEKHKVQKDRKAVQIDPEVVASVDEFVTLMVTEARLEQGVGEISQSDEPLFEHRLIGPFIGWVGKDVKKESADELEASDLEWKQVSKAVGNAARNWYLAKIEEI